MIVMITVIVCTVFSLFHWYGMGTYAPSELLRHKEASTEQKMPRCCPTLSGLRGHVFVGAPLTCTVDHALHAQIRPCAEAYKLLPDCIRMHQNARRITKFF